MKRSIMASYQSPFASWSVRKKLLAAAMVMFLSAGGVIVRLGFEKRHTLIEKAKTQSMLVVDGLAGQQKEIAAGTEYLLSTLALAPVVRSRDGAACNDFFGRLNELHPFFTAIGAATPDGVVFASSGALKTGTGLSGRSDFRGAAVDRRLSAGDLTGGEADGGPSVSFAYPVVGQNGELLAVLTAGFRIGGRRYVHLLERMHLPPGSTVNYVDRNGMRLWRLPAGRAAPTGKPLASARLKLIGGQSDRGYFEQRGADGVFRLYAFAQLRLEPEDPPYMYIMAGMPEEALIKQADGAMATELLLLGVIGVLALFATLLFGNLAIARPIEKLVLAARRIGGGEESARTGLPHTADEFGRLAKNFDDMADLLEKKNAERRLAREALGKAYDESEAMVQKRTAELSETNAALMAEIAERKLAEEERKRLATAIEQSADAIIITDTDWNISYVNPAFTAMTGYGRAEAIGLHFRVLKSDRHNRAFYKEIRETLKNGKVWTGRIINRKKDGSLYETEATASPVRNKSGEIINIVASHRDIAERLRLEKELRQAHKMEALGSMAGGIAHDFNNILGAILGNTEIAMCKLSREDPACANLGNVLKAGERAAELVKRILAFSRKSDHLRLPVPIASLVEETLSLLAPSLPEGVRITKDTGSNPEAMVVLADPTEIHQVLINLCTNAAHAMSKEGGELRVGLSRLAVSPRGEPIGRSVAAGLDRALEQGSYICLTVSDTGVGIDPSIIEKIFDPYFTTKAVGEGTGLGLTVVQGLVRSNGGAIAVESQPGEGATFRVFLQAIEKSARIGPGVFEVSMLERSGKREAGAESVPNFLH